MKCAVGPLRALPARPAVHLQGRPGAAPRRRRAAACGWRSCERAAQPRACGSSPPATAASCRSSTARTSCCRWPASSTSPTSSRPAPSDGRGPLRPLDRRGLDHDRARRRAHPRDPRALAPADRDRRVRDGRRDPGAAQLRRRRGLRLASSTPARSTSPRSATRRRSSDHVARRLRAPRLPARQGPAAGGHQRLPQRAPAGRSPPTASASSASARGNVCVMVAHGTPCLGPVTHAGCGALCPSYHRGCYGCFGPMEAPNAASLGRLAARITAERDVARRSARSTRARRRSGEASARWLTRDPHTRRWRASRARARCTCACATAASRTCSSRIYEPPRFFEAFLRGRRFTEVPDITARICGICPVAYQMSSIAAMEDVCGVEVPEPIRALRRLLYCGEWIESHGLHVFFLHAPGLPRLRERVRRWPATTRAVVESALALKKAGNDAHAGRRRARDPPGQRARRRLLPRAHARRARRGRAAARGAHASSRATRSGWTASLPLPELRGGLTSFVALRAPGRATRSRAGAWSPRAGSTSRPPSTSEHFVEEHVEHSTALHSRLRRRRRPTSSARWPATRSTATGSRRWPARPPPRPGSSPCAATRSAASSCAPWRSSTRSTRRCGCIDALRAARTRPASRSRPAPGVGYGWTEAPRGLLWHRYEIDERGHDPRRADRAPDLAEPGAGSSRPCTASSSATCELDDDELRLRCEQAIRSYDPCISCATHFLRLEVDRG